MPHRAPAVPPAFHHHLLQVEMPGSIMVAAVAVMSWVGFSAHCSYTRPSCLLSDLHDGTVTSKEQNQMVRETEADEAGVWLLPVDLGLGAALVVAGHCL